MASLNATTQGLQDVTAPLDDEPVVAKPTPTYRPGDLLARRYRIDHLLARGGMADVYAATDLGMRRAVALKVASGDPGDDAAASERLLREAGLLTGLRHPGIVSVHEQGRTVRGTAFIALERVKGFTLRDYLAQHRTLPWQSAAAIAIQIASALEAAHAQDIVHCDLSPSNVLIVPSERGALSCKLIDFGIASRAQEPRGAPLHGTRRYLAPESRTGEVDVRLDLHALGVILAEMLGPDAPSALSQLAKDLQAADPKARPPSASAALAVLRWVTGADVIVAAPSRPPPHVPEPSRLAWSVVGAALLVSGGALISAVADNRSGARSIPGAQSAPPSPVRAELQDFPARVAVPDFTMIDAVESKPAAPVAFTPRAVPRLELEAALLERRKQLFELGADRTDVIAVTGISFDPSRSSARVVYRRVNPAAELVEYWAVRDGRWQPVSD